MPFYKWTINTSNNPGSRKIISDSVKNENYDINLAINNRMVNVIRHLSQLLKVADDVFGSIEIEYRSLLSRTTCLTERIESFQVIVDSLNAKTVKVPVSSLTGNQDIVKTPFRSCDEKDLGHIPIFCAFPRPTGVENLRNLASGPSPPAVIPSGEVVSETDVEATTSKAETTHIYCKHLQIPQVRNSKKSLRQDSKDKIDEGMKTSVPSTVVPIDVSGQSFSRMASLRRSLIHVDFFIRRKKKDKRRNTVAEGDTKELKNALQNIINDRQIVPNGNIQKNCVISDLHKTHLEEITNGKDSVLETNNNFAKVIACTENNMSTKTNISPEQNKLVYVQNDSIKLDSKNNYNSSVGKTSISKGKAKSHIPISTISAAMNVAVGMRQRNGNKSPSSNGNDNCISQKNSSHSECKKIDQNVKNFSSQPVNGEDSGFSESYKVSKHKKIKQSDESKGNEEADVFSSASSENTTVQDDDSLNATSVESDAFFISSEESDEESSDILNQKYGSSNSISTMSNGSLNSLLSRTGTEMASSTGTLTSIGIERYPTPPPPPPPFITNSSFITKNEITIEPSPGLTNLDENLNSVLDKQPPKKHTPSKGNRKSTPSKKLLKIDSNKNEKLKTLDSKKSIFTNLVNKKLRIKEQTISKDSKNNSITRPEMFIDMYGNNSPQNPVQLPTFLKENVPSVSKVEPQAYLQSFLPKNSNLKSVKETESIKCIKNSQVLKDIDDINELSLPSDSNSSSDATIKCTEVPLKYVQQVVVTPIARQNFEHNDKYMCRKSLFSDNTRLQNIEKGTDLKPQIYCHIDEKNVENNTSGSYPYRPQRPNSFQAGVKPAARVVLDPEGRVIYATNSLDRRLPCELSNQFHITRTNLSGNVEYSVPPSTKNFENSSYNVYLPFKNSSHQSTFKEANVPNRSNHFVQPTLHNRNTTSLINSQINENSNFSEYSSRASTMNCRTLSPKNVTETQPYGIKSQDFNFSPSTNPVAKISPPPYEEAVVNSQILISNPNIAGLPHAETRLTEQNINIHLQNMERLNKMRIDKLPDSRNISKKVPCPQGNTPGSMENNLSKLKGSTMSTEDLFAVIHDCKKRMNIKTDSDISSSSRSNSPSYFRTPPQKGTFVETGFLSPRSTPSNFNCSRDRRSWADFRSVSSSPDERRSLASDRLGRTKPTSMHDFKMLLLQARSNTQISGPRKSAVELLKVPSSSVGGGNSIQSPTGTSPHFSYSHQNSPTSPTYIHNGHSTVPFKRHNNRARSSLQSRYTMYPPIFEDCSEENENGRDIISK